MSSLLLHCNFHSLAATSGGYSLVKAPRLLFVVASLVAEHRFQGSEASVAAAQASVALWHVQS